MMRCRPYLVELRLSTSGRATAASIVICGGTEVVKWAVCPRTTQVTRANDALIVVVGKAWPMLLDIRHVFDTHFVPRI